MKKTLMGILLFALPGLMHLNAAEYFVGKQGNDANDGLTKEKAFLTVQKGVNAIQPGDTLTIGPGEYGESVLRDKLGNAENDTIIRAEIPGTAVLRGDIPVQAFKKVDGTRFVYAADLAITGNVVVVNELDTLKILEKMPNVTELEFRPGVFYQDQAAGKLYISTSDMQPADQHRYTATVRGTHGIYLSNPRRVIVEGLAMTGFNAEKELSYREGTHGGVWGLFLFNGKSCVIRDCRAWLNGWGIGLNSGAKTSGDNVIERCAAWANTSQFWSGDMGGLTVFSARRDVIRDSTAFLNGMYGVNIYGTGTDGGEYAEVNVPGNDEPNKSRLANNLAWGNNGGDFKIKTGVTYFHIAERCVGLGPFFGILNIAHCSIAGPSYNNYQRRGMTSSVDSIIFSAENNLDLGREFADPANYDFRLQDNSRFRKTAPGGKDRGPFQYEKNIYYVRADGDDNTDGISVSNAWKTLPRATRGLRAGDTLYIQPGVYHGDLELKAQGKEGKPISICGRGLEPVVMAGKIEIKDSSHIEFKRLHFREEVKLAKSDDIRYENCQFRGDGDPATERRGYRDVGLDAKGVNGLSLSHCVFTGFKEAAVALKDCVRVFLSGNLYDNREGPAVRMDGIDGIKYSDYNSYRRLATAWEVDGKSLAFPEVQKSHERYSPELTPDYAVVNGIDVLKNPGAFAAVGPLGKTAGLYRDEKKPVALSLILKPKVHSVSATTANIEWMTSLPATCELAWGDTPECVNTNNFIVDYFGSYSLTGLKPGQTCYFRIKSLRPPKRDEWLGELADKEDDADAKTVALNEEALSITTLKEDRAAAVYYVAPDGKDTNSGLDRQNAWKTIQYAAGKVTVGDTVLIAGGQYPERVQIRATGETNAPITFTCLPGEKVVMDGAGKALNNAFVVAGKNQLRFDGLYLRDFNLNGPGEFNLYKCRDIRIERCFSESTGYAPSTVYALYVENLLVKNCVFISKMGGALQITRSPNMHLEHNVSVRPLIGTFTINNLADQKVYMEDNIFTDMLVIKAKQNFVFAELEEPDSLQLTNNCFLVRCFPPEQRIIFADVDHAIHKHTRKFTMQEFDQAVSPTHSIFADPMFAGDPVVAGLSTNTASFAPERMLNKLPLDFNSFFATNPELVKRGIGLQPEAFKDFKFGTNSETERKNDKKQEITK